MKKPVHRLKPLCVHVWAALSLTGCLALPAAHASSTGLVISQVYGGGGSSGTVTYQNDYVELFNAGAAAVSLSGLSLQYASATGTGNFSALTLNAAVLQPGQYYLVRTGSTGSAGAVLPVTPDQTTSSMSMGATGGKVALVQGTAALACNGGSMACSTAQLAQIIDLVGYGSANFHEGSSAAPAPSTVLADYRANAGCTDTDDNGTDFSTAAPVPRFTGSDLVDCGNAGNGGGSGSGSSGNEGSTVSIAAIQGDGSTSPYVNQSVSTTGVVTLVMNNGFFMQSLVEDGNDATSDGILVYTGSAPTVSVGQAISLTATVKEYNTGASTNATTAAHTVTELTSPSALTVLSSGHSIVPKVITLPATDAELEALEGMLVTINSQLTASQNYFQGRYGQVTLSAQGRLENPTNKYRPGTADAIAMAQSNAQRLIMLDDASSLQNPNPTPYIGADNTLRAGDTVDSVTGVIDYGLSTSDNTGIASYKIQPTQAVAFTRANARTTQPDTVGGNVRIASANVLNYFSTFSDGNTAAGLSGQGCAPSGTTSDCRGADSAAEFARQRAKLIAEISALNADVVGLMELQNNSAAVQDLVAGLNDKLGAGTYAVVPDPASGVGTDAIKVGLIYKPARVTRVGASGSDTSDTHKRPSVAQTFAALNGEAFTVVVNHFKSKGCSGATGDDADQNDGQGCYNASRVAEAQALHSFVSDLQTSTGVDRVILLGDFNAYSQEDPVHALTSTGYTDLGARFSATPYSYVFNGESGALDHALATPTLNALVSGTTEWHVNADEPSIIDYNLEYKQPACASCGPDYYTATPYRSSDHDPVLVGLNLVKTITGTSRSETLVGTPGDDRIIGGSGSDTLTGNGGANVFVYTSVRDALDLVTDFVPGVDRLDLSAIAASLRATAGNTTDLIAGGYIQLVDTANGLEVRTDSDGWGSAASARPLLRLKGVSASQIVPSRDLIQ